MLNFTEFLNKFKKIKKVERRYVRIYTGILGQYGDIVMFTAVIRKIKEIYPNSFVTFAISKKYQEIKVLLENNPKIDKVFITQFYFDKFNLNPKVINLWYKGKKKIDWCGEDEIIEQSKYDLVFETRPVPKKRNWLRDGYHHIWHQGNNIGITHINNFQTELYPQENGKVSMPAKYIALHTRAGWPKKTLSLRRFEKLVELLQKFHLPLYTIGSNEDSVISSTIDLCGKITINQMAMIIRDAILFIGLDSLPIHVAGAFHTPTVGIYSGADKYYSPEVSLPFNPNAIYIIAKDGKHCDSIDIKEIYSAVTKLLNLNENRF